MRARAPKALDEAEQARVAASRDRVMALMPEFVPCIKALYGAGLIPGWRAVAYVGPHREGGRFVAGPFLRGDEFRRSRQAFERELKNGTHR